MSVSIVSQFAVFFKKNINFLLVGRTFEKVWTNATVCVILAVSILQKPSRKGELLCILQNLHRTNRLKSRSCIFRRAWVLLRTGRFCTACRLRESVRWRSRYPACRAVLRMKTESLPVWWIRPANMKLPFAPKTHSARLVEALCYRLPMETSAARR